MTEPRKVGSAYQEALLALSEQVAKIFREDWVNVYIVDEYLIQDDKLICLSVVFPESGSEAWVPLEIGKEGWDEHRRARIVHDVHHVLNERLKLERLTAEFVASRIR